MENGDELSSNIQSLVESIDRNIREIEEAVKADSKTVDKGLNTQLTKLKRIRLELRLINSDSDDPLHGNSARKEAWEMIAQGRKLLEEQQKIFKNR